MGCFRTASDVYVVIHERYSLGDADRGKGSSVITGTQTATRTIDVYRTRLADRSQIEPRSHSVVWGTDAPGPLSGEQLRGYDQRGYHTAESVL